MMAGWVVAIIIAFIAIGIFTKYSRWSDYYTAADSNPKSDIK